MNQEEIEQALGDVLVETSERENVYGEYHPSTINGCELKSFLRWMQEDNGAFINSYTLAGTAVHYYFEKEEIIHEALHRAGYHYLNTDMEISTTYTIVDDVVITGTTDIITAKDDTGEQYILDLKFSSLKPSYGHGRIMGYLAQAHTYARMFGADNYALLLVNSREGNHEDFLDSIAVLEGAMDEDMWETTKDKALSLHEALGNFNYEDGQRYHLDEMGEKDLDFWEEVMEYFDESRIPLYDKECRYCDFKDFCPVKNNRFSNLAGMVDD